MKSLPSSSPSSNLSANASDKSCKTMWEEDEVPFGDDLDPSVGIEDGDDQGAFFHLGRGGGEQQQAEETPVIPAPSQPDVQPQQPEP